ncbi:MAG TPA: DUF6776 family protein [Steroidobacteraceae bacterium]|nr:DUF6776 family protein [Steroidobacteraceae bacterium]
MPQNLVVRTYAPARRIIMGAALALLSALALYAAYELGRFDAGYDRMAVAQQRTELEVEIGRLEEMNRELRAKLADLETMRVGQARERAEVARTIGDLQAQVARQQQDLAFFRGIVTQGAASLGVKIQQLRIARSDTPGRYHVRITLVQSGRPDSVVSGALAVKLEGEAAGQAAAYDLAALTSDKQGELPFSFRYFENFDREIALPPGFAPERLTVVVRATRKGVTPLTQSFLWKVDAA